MRSRLYLVFVTSAVCVASYSTASSAAPPTSAAPATTPQPAPSAPPAQRSKAQVQEASARYERGLQLYNDGDYKLAAIEFERAYELSPAYQVLYNVGQVNFQLNNYAKALKAFQQYLSEGGSRVPEERRRQVQNDIKQLMSRTAHINVNTNVAGADITVDDIAVGKAPLSGVLIDAGQHKVVAVHPGRQDASKVITLAAGDDAKLVLELPEIDQPRATPEKKSYTWIGWVATGVFAAGAIGTGIATYASYNTFKNDRNAPAADNDPDGTQKQSTLSSDKTRAETLYTTTAILGGAAVVAAGVTLYFTLKEGGSEKPQINVGAGLGKVTLSGTF